MITEMDDVDYFARPELSTSQAKVLLSAGGPARYRWQLEHGRPPRAAYDFGHAAHLVALGKGEPVEIIPEEICASNGAWTTKEAKAAVAAARAAGRTPLKLADWQQVQDMAEQLLAHPQAAEILTDPEIRAEVAMFGEVFGVPFRGKADLLGPSGPDDYKTTAEGTDAHRFARAAFDFGYDIQDAAYRSLAAQNGWTGPRLRFIVQEKTAPYLVAVYELSDEARSYGALRLQTACELWLACSKTDEWPGHPTHTQTLQLPAWRAAQLTQITDPDEPGAPVDFDQSLAAWEASIGWNPTES